MFIFNLIKRIVCCAIHETNDFYIDYDNNEPHMRCNKCGAKHNVI